MTTLLWFGRDLRLADNPALSAAAARGELIVPVYILDDKDSGKWAPGAASRWWLHRSLERLSADLERRGSRLILRSGSALDEIPRLASEIGARAVYWNRRYEPWAVARGRKLKSELEAAGFNAQSFNANLIHEPPLFRTKSGTPYSVYTPFRKALRASLSLPAPLESPRSIARPTAFPASDDLRSWNLLPRIPWDEGLKAAWTPGEAGAQARLTQFLNTGVLGYADTRNFPGRAGTSRLSPHLHFGEIGPRQVWRAAINQSLSETGSINNGTEVFLSEIAWREFSYHLLFHHPDLPDAPLRKKFSAFPWRTDSSQLQAWQEGRTGVPIVDAGLRELWHTGWMHNRVRMIVASFLVKNFLIDWREGASWFWDTLVDADLANNSTSWQWVAGCGTDAAPYFRIFNPTTQGKAYDPDGVYVRRWIPEIAKLPDERIHEPWTAQPLELAEARIKLGTTYALPLVPHASARQRALAALRSIS